MIAHLPLNIERKMTRTAETAAYTVNEDGQFNM